MSLLKHLPDGIRSRLVANGNGLQMHVLEAGRFTPARPSVVLLHGFPELAYSWRRIMPALAEAGFHVIAPDQRGFGRTLGADTSYDTDLAQYRMLNLVADIAGLVTALQCPAVYIVGHDVGAGVASWCALTRPDLFRAVVIMAAPFAGPPAGQGRTGANAPRAGLVATMNSLLGRLPRPRKHYQWYFTTRAANDDMTNAPQGLQSFLRGYFHCKSGDWEDNRPFPLRAWTPEELAQLPTYYIMDAAATMAQIAAREMPAAPNSWLPDQELAVFADEYRRTGFQGGLQWYRARMTPGVDSELATYHGRKIEAPGCYIAGERDWGTYQFPGAFEAMPSAFSAGGLKVEFVKGAGHWVQQERPEDVTNLLTSFLSTPAR